jgi:O-antigen/teichoic acid export membrane protein
VELIDHAGQAMATAQTGRLSLRRNFLWSLWGTLAESGAKWVIFVLLARQAPTQAVGTFFLALAIATPITILAQLQLRIALITDAGNEHDFDTYHALRLFSVAVALALISVLALALYGIGLTTALIITVGCAQASISLREIWAALAQKHERMDVSARGAMLDGLLSIVFFAAALLATGSVLWAAAGLVLAHLMTLALHDIRRVRAAVGRIIPLLPRWRYGAVRRLFRAVWPLGLSTALMSLQVSIPKYFVEYWIGRQELGYFAALAYLVMAAEAMMGSVAHAVSPRLSILYRESPRRYGALVLRCALGAAVAGACAVLGVWLWGDSVIEWLYGAEYVRHDQIMVVLMAAGGIAFVNAFLSMAIAAARSFRLYTITHLLLVLVCMVACGVLVPRWGLEGAAWVAVITAGVHAILGVGACLYVYWRAPARGQQP